MPSASVSEAVILVIDNDPILLTGTAAVLHSVGYECHCARDSQAALKAARSLALDLIVCDVTLAGESGLDLCRTIRALPGCIDVPVLFVSKHQLPDVVRRTHDAGGAYFLRKPFDPEVLIELVGKALWMPHLVRGKLGGSAVTRADLASSPQMATGRGVAHHIPTTEA